MGYEKHDLIEVLTVLRNSILKSKMRRCPFGYWRILPCNTVSFSLDFLPRVEYNKSQLEAANQLLAP